MLVPTKPAIAAALATAKLGLDPVGTTQREVQQRRPSTSGDPEPRGLRRQRGLIGDLVEHDRFDELRHRQRSGHFDQRLVGEHHVTFGDRPHIPREPQRCQGIDRRRIEALLCEPGKVGVVELELGEQTEHVLQAGRDEEPPTRWERADEQAERRRLRHSATQVARRHRQLIEVRHQPESHDHILPAPMELSPGPIASRGCARL